MHSDTHLTHPVIKLCIIVVFIFSLIACKNTSVSNPAQANPAIAQNPVNPETTPTPAAAVPSPNAPTPVASIVIPTPAPGSSASPSPSGSPEIKHITDGKVPVIKGTQGDPNDMLGYKPTPTPTPAPTPSIVMVNGKIKQEWEAPAEFAELKSPLKVTPEIIKKGKYLYTQRCELCHGAEGKGNGGYNSPQYKQSTNLTSKVTQANSDGELFYKVSNSRDRHPSSKVIYSDDDRWAVVAFLRTLK